MEEAPEMVEDQIINEEYKIWKKNSPFLYDYVLTSGLVWPSLTVEWLPTVEDSAGGNYSIHELVMGTHTANDEPNYLIIAKTLFPHDQEMSHKEEVKKEPYPKTEEKRDNFSIKMEIPHNGEVNRARFMPQQSNIIATQSPSGKVYIYDYTKHPCRPEMHESPKPELTLDAQKKEGFGLSWNPKHRGQLLSSSFDGCIYLWDIEKAPNLYSLVEPMVLFEDHTDPVEDVAWHKFDPHTFASAGDDKKFMLWDIRKENRKPIYKIEAHSKHVLSLNFNPFNEYLLATSSSDKTIQVWDLRKLSSSVHSLRSHYEEVYSVRWSPFNESVLASGSLDRRVFIWDLGRVGKPQTAEEASEGPPELLFVHGGHTSKITDISWNPNKDLMITSVANDNVIQIWEMANEIYYEDLEKAN